MVNLTFAIRHSRQNRRSCHALTRVAATSNSCSRWRGNPVLFAVESAFTLPWNSCSFCRGIPVHFGVEYSYEVPYDYFVVLKHLLCADASHNCFLSSSANRATRNLVA